MKAPGGDERASHSVVRERRVDPERDRSRDRDGAQGDEHPVRDPRPQRAAVQLVERVRSDPDGEEERGQRDEEPPDVSSGASAGADRDVARGATACTADEGASRSRASRPARARRTRAGSRSRRCRPQMTIAAAEAEAPATRTSSMPAPRQSSSCSVERQLRVEARGCSARGSEPTSCQPGEMHAARDGQADADVELPQRPPEPARERRTRAPAIVPPGRTTRASSRERRRRVVDVAQEVRERERVEGRVRERQLARRAPRRAESACEPAARRAARRGEHLGALVEPDDAAAGAPDELDRDRARPGRDVEHRVAGPASTRETRKRRQRGSWPSESRRLAVVGRPERREELLRAARAAPRRATGASLCLPPWGSARISTGRGARPRPSPAPGEELAGVFRPSRARASAPTSARSATGEERTWLVLDDGGEPVTSARGRPRRGLDRGDVRARRGDRGRRRARGAAGAARRAPADGEPGGIEEAEEAALELERAIGAPPRVAEPALPRPRRRGGAPARARARRPSPARRSPRR